MPESSDGQTSEAGDPGNRDGQNRVTGTQRQRERNRGNRQKNRGSRFEGRCADLKKFVYDVPAGAGNQELFITTTRAIAEYIATEYDDAAEYLSLIHI